MGEGDRGMNARLLTTFKALVRELIAPHAYHALIRYRVVANSAGRLELQIVKKGTGFPDALPISLQPGMPGAKGEPMPGAIVLVSFIEGNPTMPVVTHFARPDDGAFVP